MSSPTDAPERATRVLGRGDTNAHLRRLRELDPELERKADAWVAFFSQRGVKRSRDLILETWARLESDVPPWPPEVEP